MSAYQREINAAKKEGFARNNFSKINKGTLRLLSNIQKDPPFVLEKFLNAPLNNLSKYVLYIIEKETQQNVKKHTMKK